jgi:hypothetical protein
MYAAILTEGNRNSLNRCALAGLPPQTTGAAPWHYAGDLGNLLAYTIDGQ